MSMLLSGLLCKSCTDKSYIIIVQVANHKPYTRKEYNMELVVIQYNKNGRLSQEVIPFHKVVNTSVPADVFAKFRVKPDTCDITLKVYEERWNRFEQGLISMMGVPYIMLDFLYSYKKKPYIYLLVSFVGGHLIFDFLRGNQPQLLKEPKEPKLEEGGQCKIFHREDMPDGTRNLCDYVPLDTIDIW